MTITELSPSIDPAVWHRRLCIVNDWLAVSGDLDTDQPAEGRRQLRSWVDGGVTDILDLRDEWEDIDFVEHHAPELGYHWLGTHDSGDDQSDTWFDEGLRIGRAVREAGGMVSVHCHMGVNRAPSMAFRMLLDHGIPPTDALYAIRAARPIAGLIYADSALDHHHRSVNATSTRRQAEKAEVTRWFDDNLVDVAWIISRIRVAVLD